MKSLAMFLGLALAACAADTAKADSGPVLIFTRNGRFYIVSRKAPPTQRTAAPRRKPTSQPRFRPTAPNRKPAAGHTVRPYPPMPRPDVHLRPFSIYSDTQMRRLQSWIANNPYWTPDRKRSQARWWFKENVWMKAQNASHIQRTFSNPYQRRP